jgi:hypothetical protein
MSKKKEALLRQARLRFNSARKIDKKERLLAEQDTRFAINDEGCQWDKKTREIREGANPPRPCLVMNKTAEKVAQTEGEFRKLKPSIKVKAVDSLADPKIAEIIASIIRNVEYNSTARAAYNTSHSCVLNGGRGFWRINIVDSEDDPFEQDIEIGRIPNSLSVTFDPAAKKIDRSDGNFFFISEDVPMETFKKEYPGIPVDDWPDDESYNDWKREDSVRVAEYWWKDKGTKTAYRVDRDGLEMTVWTLLPGETSIKEKEVSHPNVRWCKMVASQVIEGPFDDWPGKYLPLISELGIETNVNGVQKTRGMVRFAKEPQQMYNYWTSAEAEQIQAVREPYLMTPAMMGKHQKQWDQSATRNYKYLFYEADPKTQGLGPRREQAQQVSTAMLAAKQGMEHDIMSAMNVYRASLGDESSEISGKAIVARTAQSNISGYNYTDMFEYALIYSAKVLIDIIPHVYDSERIIRIRGEGDTERTVPINARPDSPIMQQGQFDEEFLVQTDNSDYINDIGIGKYDVVATIGPAYTTQREEALNTLIEVLELMPNLAAASPDLVVSLLDIPMSDELLKRAKKLVPPGLRTLEPGEEEPEPEGPSFEQQLEMKKLELEGIKTMIEGFDSKIDAIAKLMTAEAKEQGQQLQEITTFVSALKEREQMQTQGGQ